MEEPIHIINPTFNTDLPSPFSYVPYELLQSYEEDKEKMRILIRTFLLNDTWWDIYILEKTVISKQILHNLARQFNGEAYLAPLKKLLNTKTKVNGFLYPFILGEQEKYYLIAVIFTSKSPYLRITLRYLFRKDDQRFLMEKPMIQSGNLGKRLNNKALTEVKDVIGEAAYNILVNEILNNHGKRKVNVSPFKVNESFLRSLKKREEIIIKKLKIALTNEHELDLPVQYVSLEGNNVWIGIDTYVDRQEIEGLKKFVHQGRWIAIETKNIVIDTRYGVSFHSFDVQTLDELYSLLKDDGKKTATTT